MAVQYNSHSGEHWLNVTAFVGVEVNPRDAAKYDVETLEATTRAAYEQAVREMEAIFATARYVKE
jgi:DNA-binding protein YbaB